MQRQNRCTGLDQRGSNLQTAPSLRPQRSVSFRQYQISSNHSHRGHDNDRADDKDRAKLGRELIAVRNLSVKTFTLGAIK